MRCINFVAAAGGQGLTSTAVRYALHLNREVCGGVFTGRELADVATVSGVLSPDENVPAIVLLNDDVSFEINAAMPDITIGGPARDGVLQVLVTRPCYPAWKRAVSDGIRPDVVLLLDEPGRTLELGHLPFETMQRLTVPWSHVVQRRIDAGLLVHWQVRDKWMTDLDEIASAFEPNNKENNHE